ncbi:MAG: hypothetical protein K2Q22_09495 [Cytophagales bacterium]|nr:hypothetical protein [Cytophagales bacterium]
MKKVISIVLLSAVLLNVFSKGIILIQYQWNKSYISQNLCENKAVKSMKCEGKCPLKKQLEKDAKQEQSSSRNALKEKMDVQFYSSIVSILPISFPTNLQVNQFAYSFSMGTSLADSIFHPPA